MRNTRQFTATMILIIWFLPGVDPIEADWVRSANAQNRTVNTRRNQTPPPTITLRSRREAQTDAHAIGYSAQPVMSRQSASGSWPGPQRPVQQRPVASNGGRIVQTASAESFQLPPTGPILIGPHRKRIRDYSWIYIDPPQPQEIKLHDIVTIIVDEKSEVIMNSRFNRQRQSKLKAELKEFVRIGQGGNLAPAALNAPTIDAQLQGTLNSTGQLTDQEGIKYRIAATVVDVLPNGVLQLEARKKIQTQDDISEYTLTGELRATDVNPDNTASSENIASLNIVKQQKGRVYDSTKRNWGYRLYDLLSPF